MAANKPKSVATPQVGQDRDSVITFVRVQEKRCLAVFLFLMMLIDIVLVLVLVGVKVWDILVAS